MDLLIAKISTPLLIIDIILGAILLYLLFNEVFLRWRAKRVAHLIENEEFRKGMHKAQVIDVRDRDTYNAGHILGARSMPYYTLKEVKSSLRKDKPVYLYDQKKTMSVRAASKLSKDGFSELYILKDGYEGWDGKTKKG